MDFIFSGHGTLIKYGFIESVILFLRARTAAYINPEPIKHRRHGFAGCQTHGHRVCLPRGPFSSLHRQNNSGGEVKLTLPAPVRSITRNNGTSLTARVLVSLPWSPVVLFHLSIQPRPRNFTFFDCIADEI